MVPILSEIRKRSLSVRRGPDVEAHRFTVYLSPIPDYVCAPGETWDLGPAAEVA